MCLFLFFCPLHANTDTQLGASCRLIRLHPVEDAAVAAASAVAAAALVVVAAAAAVVVSTTVHLLFDIYAYIYAYIYEYIYIYMHYIYFIYCIINVSSGLRCMQTNAREKRPQ